MLLLKKPVSTGARPRASVAISKATCLMISWHAGLRSTATLAQLLKLPSAITSPHRPRWLPFLKIEDDVRVRLIVIRHALYPVGMVAVDHVHVLPNVDPAPPAHVGPTAHAWIEL